MEEKKKVNLEDLPKDAQMSPDELKKVKGGKMTIKLIVGKIWAGLGGGGGGDGSTGGGSGATGVRG
jgi:hypothetical protein